MECLLHIGMCKTGSKSIQAAIASYDDGVWACPDFGTPFQKQALVTLLAASPEDHMFHSLNGHTRQQALEMREQLRPVVEAKLSSGRSIILSGEDLSRPSLNDIIGAPLHDYLKQRFDRVRGLAYIRSLPGFTLSMFQQHLKRDPLLRIDDALPSYRRNFAQWIQRFDNDLELVRFRRGDLIGGDSVSDFAARCGIGPLPQLTRNVAFSAEATAFLYTYRTLRPFENFDDGFGPRIGRVNLEIGSIGRQRLVFAPALSDRLVLENADDIAWMAERLPGNFIDNRAFLSTIDRPVSDHDAFTLDEERQLYDLAANNVSLLAGLVAGFQPTSTDRLEQICDYIDELHRRKKAEMAVQV